MSMLLIPRITVMSLCLKGKQLFDSFVEMDAIGIAELYARFLKIALQLLL